MNIYGIEHVQLTMPSGREIEAVDFYEGVLGLKQVSKPELIYSNAFSSSSRPR